MLSVFICYRNKDEAYAAALLDEALSRAFGASAIFRASRSIAPGDDYPEVLLSALSECRAMLVLIGPGWKDHLASSDNDVVEPIDWVKVELRAARQGGMRVIPVLLHDASRLAESDLPHEISWLSRLQYLRLDYRHLKEDLGKIEHELNGVASSLPAITSEEFTRITMETRIKSINEIHSPSTKARALTHLLTELNDAMSQVLAARSVVLDEIETQASPDSFSPG